MPNEALATIRGIVNIPSITEINVRSGAGTHHDLAFRVPVGMSGLDVLEVIPDEESRMQEGKLYQWFKLMFHGGAVGWVRDDLLTVEGDLSAFDYPNLMQPTWAFDLQRSVAVVEAPIATDPHHNEGGIAPIGERPMTALPVIVPTRAPVVAPFTPASQDKQRVRAMAFMLTSAFEGTGYASYNNFDAGIVSYGFIQFTLAGGSLARVLDIYLRQANSGNVTPLRGFMSRVQQHDPSLRHDVTFKDLLLNAAKEVPMQQAQDQVATEGYWKQVLDGYIIHRDLQMPLSWALLFDMGVNFGVNHGFVRLAEKNLGVLPRSKPGENGISEAQLIEEIARLRKVSHDRQAERDNLPGLRVRGDFWVERVQKQDWMLMGDGQKVVANGRIIKTT